MPFTEREPFVLSGVQSDDSAWNKAGSSFGTKLWRRSHVVGWRSTSSNTRRRLRGHGSGYNLSVIGGVTPANPGPAGCSSVQQIVAASEGKQLSGSLCGKVGAVQGHRPVCLGRSG